MIEQQEDQPVKTLKDVMPYEFRRDFTDTRAFMFKDVEVIEEREQNWPGDHKNVYFWVKLANGYAVGWNENPAVGWSFPVIKLRG